MLERKLCCAAEKVQAQLPYHGLELDCGLLHYWEGWLPVDSVFQPCSILQSLGEMPQLQKTLTSPADAAGFLQGSRDSGGSSKDSCDTDDFVMVPAQFPGQIHSQYLLGMGWVDGV